MTRCALRLATALLLAPPALYFAAVGALGYWPRGPAAPATATGREITVFIRSNGVHTDLVVPIAVAGVDWRRDFAPHYFRQTDPTHAYVAFGWGDKRFYLEVPTWSDLTVRAALSSVLGGGPAVLHVTYLPQPSVGRYVQSTRLAREEYLRLAEYLRRSVIRNADGSPSQVVSPWQEAHDALFDAPGSYSPLMTCNEWTRRGLAEAGLRTAVWAVFPFAVFHHLEPAH